MSDRPPDPHVAVVVGWTPGGTRPEITVYGTWAGEDAAAAAVVDVPGIDPLDVQIHPVLTLTDGSDSWTPGRAKAGEKARLPSTGWLWLCAPRDVDDPDRWVMISGPDVSRVNPHPTPFREDVTGGHKAPFVGGRYSDSALESLGVRPEPVWPETETAGEAVS